MKSINCILLVLIGCAIGYYFSAQGVDFTKLCRITKKQYGGDGVCEYTILPERNNGGWRGTKSRHFSQGSIRFRASSTFARIGDVVTEQDGMIVRFPEKTLFNKPFDKQYKSYHEYLKALKANAYSDYCKQIDIINKQQPDHKMEY